ncbi:hypothetical protein [Meiothermus taiwanensis]|uniref:Uncharacterized protein n=1 Tax=Meiothermus taiwanensis WR-220 TaxID=1339250 RepID=A0ABN5M185_9DEIN|nr:hypothetical protein [Meiothermus taiwanensis]AWR86749.1 hypothetical protein Mtai_v1c15070 [Meiothermus taiwanensis WR-220]KIQ55319.1 hypothetical protein SY28_04110 [Meiothermus taiwanensis]KZK15079.1 hypothetical protein A3962_11655 [Meiothermus taiwanensis]
MLKARPWLILLAGLLLFSLRVVEVENEGEQRLLLLWAWTKGQVEFVNSVTQRPVLLRFGLPWRFQGFRAYTDPETEAYYTGGAYPWNQALAQEKRRELFYCSEAGLALGLGSTRLEVQGGCLRARLLFPP